MTRKQIIKSLQEKGVNVVGITEEFNGAIGGVWISAEGTEQWFNYHSERWYDTFGVNPKLHNFVEINGWYFEWHDAGTIMLWEG